MPQTWDEHGNVITAPPVAAVKSWDEHGNPITNGASAAGATPQNDTGAWSSIKRNTAGMVAGLYHAFTDPATDSEKAALATKEKNDNLVIHSDNPSQTTLAFHRLLDAPAAQLATRGSDQVAAAKELITNGQAWKGAWDYADGRMNQGLAMVPLAGPWVRSIADRFEAGDHSGAATDLAFGVAMENAPEAARVIKKNVLRAPLVDAVRQAAAEQVAGPIVRKTPAATMNDLKFGRSPADAITQEPGLEGVTISGLRDGVVKRMGEIGQAMDQKLQAAVPNAQPINVEPIIDRAYQDAIGSPTARLNQGLTTRLYDLASALKTKFGSLQKDPLEATQFKRELGQAAKWTGQPFDNEANQFLVDVYRGVKDTVNTAVPEVKDLNERYADLLSAKTALDRRIAFDTNRPFSIGRGLLSASGGLAGTILGGATGTAEGAAIGAAADVLRSSPSRIIIGKTLGVKHAPVTTPALPAAAPVAAPTALSPLTGAALASPSQLFNRATATANQ